MAPRLLTRSLVRTPLLYSQQPATVCLRELQGWDEQTIPDRKVEALFDFLDRMFLSTRETDLKPGEASQLSLPDRDRILSELYIHSFGDLIRSTIACRECGSRFDLEFQLGELLEDLYGPVPSSPSRAHIGPVVEDKHGNKARVPTGEDERRTVESRPETSERNLEEHCRIPGDAELESEQLQRILSGRAPLVDRVLEASCPECTSSQTARFSIQPFLLARISQEQSRLAREVDQLASDYGWGFESIMSLPRSWRKRLVDRIDSKIGSIRKRGRL